MIAGHFPSDPGPVPGRRAGGRDLAGGRRSRLRSEDRPWRPETRISRDTWTGTGGHFF